MKCGWRGWQSVEFHKKGGGFIVDGLFRIFNVCVDHGKVPKNWGNAFIVPLYEGKLDKGECLNYRGIRLLSVLSKLCGRAVIKRIKMCT